MLEKGKVEDHIEGKFQNQRGHMCQQKQGNIFQEGFEAKNKIKPQLDSMQLEHLLPELEAKLFALAPDDPGEAGVAAVEHGDLALVLRLQLREHLVPVRPA